MNDLVDLRLHHHIAQEIYRQQMLQRLPGTFCFFFNYEIAHFLIRLSYLTRFSFSAIVCELQIIGRPYILTCQRIWQNRLEPFS